MSKRGRIESPAVCHRSLSLGFHGIMYAMRPLRNFKTNQCCHLISRIANRAFFLNDEEKTRFVERLWRVATFSCVEVLAY